MYDYNREQEYDNRTFEQKKIDELHNELVKQKERSLYLEKCLNALATELNRTPFGIKVTTEASAKGGVDIGAFFNEQLVKDIEKLKAGLKEGCSQHEIEIFNKMMKSVDVDKVVNDIKREG